MRYRDFENPSIIEGDREYNNLPLAIAQHFSYVLCFERCSQRSPVTRETGLSCMIFETLVIRAVWISRSQSDKYLKKNKKKNKESTLCSIRKTKKMLYLMNFGIAPRNTTGKLYRSSRLGLSRIVFVKKNDNRKDNEKRDFINFIIVLYQVNYSSPSILFENIGEISVYRCAI